MSAGHVHGTMATVCHMQQVHQQVITRNLFGTSVTVLEAIKWQELTSQNRNNIPFHNHKINNT